MRVSDLLSKEISSQVWDKNDCCWFVSLTSFSFLQSFQPSCLVRDPGLKRLKCRTWYCGWQLFPKSQLVNPSLLASTLKNSLPSRRTILPLPMHAYNAASPSSSIICLLILSTVGYYSTLSLQMEYSPSHRRFIKSIPAIVKAMMQLLSSCSLEGDVWCRAKRAYNRTTSTLVNFCSKHRLCKAILFDKNLIKQANWNILEVHFVGGWSWAPKIQCITRVSTSLGVFKDLVPFPHKSHPKSGLCSFYILLQMVDNFILEEKITSLWVKDHC